MYPRDGKLYISLFGRIIKNDPVYADPAVFSVTVDTFHAVVTDLVGIQIATVALAAADTFTIVKNTLNMHSHCSRTPPCPDYTTSMKGRSRLSEIELRTFTEEEYHLFFRNYHPDPMMDPSPFRYNREQISRSYAYNHGGYRENYVHLGIFMDGRPVGSFQLKRIDNVRKSCEFGIILQNDDVKNRGIGTAAIRKGMQIAACRYGMRTILGDTMGRNKRMIHVFEKLGFELIETVREAFELPDGRKEDRLVYIKQIAEG